MSGRTGVAGYSDPGTEAELRAQLEKEQAQRIEAEGKLSQQGEELSQARSALDGYRRGSVITAPTNDGVEEITEDIPDPLENPDGFKKGLKVWGKKLVEKAQTDFELIANAREYARQTREKFFSKYPALQKWSQLVDFVTAQYMNEHGNDPLLKSNPGKFQEQAFKGIATDVHSRLKEMFGDKLPAQGQNAPHFESGSGGAERGSFAGSAGPEGEITYGSEAEMQAGELKDYVKDKSAQRTARK